MKPKKDYVIDAIIVAVGLGLAIGVTIYVATVLSAPINATRSDIGVVDGIISGAAVVLLLVLVESMRARRHVAAAHQTLTDSIAVYQKTLEANPTNAADVFILYQKATGIEAVRRDHIFQLLAGRNNQCCIPIRGELKRIKVLTQITNAASNYVYAYNYADPSYLEDFWITPHAEINLYLRAHCDALERRLPKLQRIFVVPDELLNGGAGNVRTLLRDITEMHERNHMKLGDQLHFVSECSVKARFRHTAPFPRISFFISDDIFVSEGEMKSCKSLGYVSFFHGDTTECLEKREEFEKILRAAQDEPLRRFW
jgi:hypothetical protein